MKNLKYLLMTILLSAFAGVGKSQELPDYKNMLQQGVDYDVIKSQAENVINSSSTLSSDEGGELNKYQRWFNFWEPRAYVNGSSTANPIGYKQAIFDYHDLYSCNNQNTPPWEFLGPKRINVTGTFIPKSVVGRVNAVAMHPSNLNVMYIGTPSSGVWKTSNLQDAEPIWKNITDGFGFDNIGVTDIVIDPANPNNIYVATGRVSNGYGIGVLVSNSGGISWNQTTLQYLQINQNDLNYVQQLRINQNSTNIIWAMYPDHVEKSINGGQSWQSTNFQNTVNNTEIKLESIELHKTNANISYVAGKEIWKSTTNNNWVQLDGDLGSNILAHHQTAGSILEGKYKISQGNDGFYVLSKIKTSTGHVFIDLSKYVESTNSWNYLYSQPHFAEKIIVSPTDPDVIYLMDIPSGFNRYVALSTNGGQTYSRQTNYDPGADDLFNGVSTHGDIRDLELVSSSINGMSDVVITGTDGGLLVSSSYSQNKMNWENKNGTTLNIAEFYGVTSVKYGEEYVAAGAQDNSKFTLIDGIWRNEVNGDGYDGYIGTDGSFNMQINFPTMQKSTNLGISYSGVPDIDHSNNPLVTYDYRDYWKYGKRPAQIMKNGDVYRGRYDLSKMEAGATSWTIISDFYSHNVNILNVLVDISVYENNDNIIFAAFGDKIFKTEDGGTIWEGITPNDSYSSHLLTGFRSIVVDPNEPNNVWVTLDGMGEEDLSNPGNFKNRVVKTENALSNNPTWTDYSEGLPTFLVEELIFEEGSNQRLYVATDVGVFYRDATMTDGWECFTNGMPGISISDIDINYCNRKIYAATHGRGLWSADLLPPDYAAIADVSPYQTAMWNTDKVVEGSVRVPTGHKLTISNANISMMSDAKIIVEAGAELIIENSTITTNCNGFWQGIEVWSNPGASNQLGNFPNRQVGRLHVTNSTLENAVTAISVDKPGTYVLGGGFVTAVNTHFLNNRKAVSMASFENYSTSGSVMDNFSSFKNCIFEVDQNFQFDLKQPLDAMVSAWGVRGVKFLGCDFVNNSDKPLSIIGLYMYNAKFTVGSLGNQDPST
ncbi:MAG: hypothetical protein ACPGVC_08460, partial [Salibacteraceae bacterium]